MSQTARVRKTTWKLKILDTVQHVDLCYCSTYPSHAIFTCSQWVLTSPECPLSLAHTHFCPQLTTLHLPTPGFQHLSSHVPTISVQLTCPSCIPITYPSKLLQKFWRLCHQPLSWPICSKLWGGLQSHNTMNHHKKILITYCVKLWTECLTGNNGSYYKFKTQLTYLRKFHPKYCFARTSLIFFIYILILFYFYIWWG